MSVSDILLYSWEQCPMWYQTFAPFYDKKEEFFLVQEVLVVMVIRLPDWNRMVTKRMLEMFASDPTFEITGSLDKTPVKVFYWVRDRL